MSKAYKYRGGRGILDKDGESIFERDVTTLVNNQLYLPTKDGLNDPTEGVYGDDALRIFFNAFSEYSHNVEEQYNKFTEKFGKVGVYSLSKTFDNELLWAYYASGHTGFAIEYDIDILEQSLNYNSYAQQLYKFDVEYLNDVPQIDISTIRGNEIVEMLKRFIGTKSSSWAHEKEVRLIFENTGLFEIDFKAVTAIYFGCRMPDGDINYIMEKLKGRGLKYFKMVNVNNSYRFEAKEIEDKYSGAPKYVGNCVSYDIDNLLLCGGLNEEEMATYKSYFINALEMIKDDPNITEFYLATINYNQHEPILRIFGNTKNPLAPVKPFEFRVEDNSKVLRIK
jgi:hypothetical protein